MVSINYKLSSCRVNPEGTQYIHYDVSGGGGEVTLIKLS